MAGLDTSVVDKIVEACIKLYSEIPKSGKPTDNEWTVLSCVVKYERQKEIEVVSLGTGSKCIGATKMSPSGVILNDSHAEVIARRGFLLYLYENIQNAIDKKHSIFEYHNSHYELKKDVEFAFFSSQLPCGDASIIPKSENDELYGDILHTIKRKIVETSQVEPKKYKLEADIHRTGAKCLPHAEQDSKESGARYHTVGLVRTKPGRGDRTLSVSCSDKIARWVYLGIQGGLLSLLCAPIYIKYYIFGAGVPYSEETLYRAIVRSSGGSVKPGVKPEFYQSSIQFQGIRTEERIRPAAGSIVWVKLHSQKSEVTVQGKKLGLTKKAISPTNSVCISKYNLYTKFISIWKSSKIKEHLNDKDNEGSIPYNKMKNKSIEYYKQWSEVKEKVFKTWTVKPDMWNFCIE